MEFLRKLVNNSRLLHILGDFEEEYDEICARRARIFARFWLLFQISKAVPAFTIMLFYQGGSMFKNYVKTSIRNLKRHKSFAFINISGLAVGIAATIILLLYVYDEVNFDGMHQNKDHIYRLISYNDHSGNYFATVPGLAASALVKDFPKVVNTVRFVNGGSTKVRAHGEDFYENDIVFTDPSVFEVFSFNLIKGDKNSVLDNPHSIVLTEATAEKYFGNDDPVGRTLDFGMMGEVIVSGIIENIPPNSHLNFTMLRPIEAFRSPYIPVKTWDYYEVLTYVQLAPSAGLEDIKADLLTFVKKNGGEDPRPLFLQSMAEVHFESASVRNQLNQNQSEKKYLYLISVIAAIIMVIACFNFMNLSTARAVDRTKEVGIRKAIGAARPQLITQFMSESVMIALLGAVFSLLFVKFAINPLNAFTGKNIQFSSLLHLDILFVLVIIVLCIGLLAGSYPAFVLASFRPTGIIQHTSPAAERKLSLRKTLVVLQFTMSIVMIIVTLSVQRQLDFLRTKRLGIDKEQIITFEINHHNVRRNYESIRQRIMQNPSIKNIAISSVVPFADRFNNIDTRPEGFRPEAQWNVKYMTINETFLETYGIEIFSGKNVSPDDGSSSKSLLINESALRELGWQDPIGKLITIPVEDQEPRELTVVGVVKDFHFASLHTKIEPVIMYVDNGQMDYFSIKTSTAGIPELVAELKTTIEQYDTRTPFSYAFLDQSYAQLYRNEERTGTIFGYSAALAVIISCLGLFGLGIYTAEKKAKEISIRKVLGSSVQSIVYLLTRELAKGILLANLLAWPIAYWVSGKWLENFAYGANAGIQIFVIGGIIAFSVMLVTICFQTIRAALANPVKSLRNE